MKVRAAGGEILRGWPKRAVVRAAPPGDAPEAAVAPAGTALAWVAKPLAETAGEFAALMKRRSRGSKTTEESRLTLPARTLDVPVSSARERRTGGAVAAKLEARAPWGGAFSTFHLSPAPLPEGEITLWARLTGVFPCLSSGCTGTTPTVLPERTHTAVAGRQ